ncbi:MAG: amidase family protein, partial [Hyphomicrobiaceae bacterium]
MTEPAGPAAAPSHLNATETLHAISKGERSVEDVMRDVLQRIDASDPTICAFCDLQAQRAMDIAKTHDSVPDEQRGPLHGLPITIKEVFDVAGMRCSWGSAIHADRTPKRDAIAVRR